MGSTRYPLRSVKRAITIPGNPAPVPTSQKVLADRGIKLTSWRLSKMCLSHIIDSVLFPIRLISLFASKTR